MDTLLKNNDVKILSPIPNTRYENLFKVYKFYNSGKDFYYYNITNKLSIPEKISKDALLSTSFDSRVPLTFASYTLYNTSTLWYIIYILNTNTSKARFFIEPGEEIIYIKPEFLSNLFSAINE